jgi:hypothetical protein
MRWRHDARMNNRVRGRNLSLFDSFVIHAHTRAQGHSQSHRHAGPARNKFHLYTNLSRHHIDLARTVTSPPGSQPLTDDLTRPAIVIGSHRMRILCVPFSSSHLRGCVLSAPRASTCLTHSHITTTHAQNGRSERPLRRHPVPRNRRRRREGGIANGARAHPGCSDEV